jgi:hypothetical protein
VLKALYCSAPGVPVVGLLQARWERKRGFQVPGVVAEDIVGELESKCVVRLVLYWALLFVCCVLCPSSPPAARGFVLLLYTKEEANHMCAALFSYVRERDVLCCRVGGRPGDPCIDPAIMAYLVPEQWRPRG